MALLARRLARSTNRPDSSRSATALLSVAAYAGPEAATTAAGALIEAWPARLEYDASLARPLADALAGLAGRLDPESARGIAAALLQAADPKRPHALEHWAKALAALALRMDQASAQGVCGEAADLLWNTLGLQKDKRAEASQASVAISALGTHLAPEKAASVAMRLVQAVASPTNTGGPAAPTAMAALAARLNGKQARIIADALEAAIAKDEFPARTRVLVACLDGLAPTLEAKDAKARAASVAGLILRHLKRSKDAGIHFGREELTAALALVAQRMEPGKAAAACGEAATLIAGAIPASRFGEVSGTLPPLAPWLEPQDAKRLGKVMIDALRRSDFDGGRVYLAQAHASFIPRMGEAESRAQCAEAVSFLLKRMEAKRADPGALQSLATALASASAGLPPSTASVPCRMAAELLFRSRVANPRALWELEDRLAALLRRSPERLSHGPLQEVVLAFGAASPLAAPLVIRLGAAPLPAQALVDLLKHPLCVGEARTVVLAQLSRHYQRPFADQWEFVKHVEAEGLPLDLASPWKPVAP
ncbi:MAG: hypothetical protein K2W96_16040 [Gemmataceae bacterium]|nr:hypothetical protein [Gemmataceae bacterium]